MKLVSAPQHDFDVYIARADTQWIEREEGDSLETLYEKGFLPYSGAHNVQNIFYSGRSARIVLPEFTLSSENRRIARKFDGQFAKERVPFAQFEPDEKFWELSLTYFAQKHGVNAMPRARLRTILDSGLITNTAIYRSIPDNKKVAYVLEVEDGSMAHYWYSFYDLHFAKQSLGVWLMLDHIRDARARGLIHYYLGTVYGEKARYKTNFSPLEWWDGSPGGGWSSDIALLKSLS